MNINVFASSSRLLEMCFGIIKRFIIIIHGIFANCISLLCIKVVHNIPCEKCQSITVPWDVCHNI
jgi:hypothetical protein